MIKEPFANNDSFIKCLVYAEKNDSTNDLPRSTFLGVTKVLQGQCKT